RDKRRRLDVALLPIGHAPWWKPGFRKGHLTSADALALFDRLQARFLIPYHWGTFNHVTSTAFDAINRLRASLPSHPKSDAVRILADVARALGYAHDEGVVHRDVKPANLMLDGEGHVHVADFGIASAAWMPSLTAHGTVLGTAGYLSPEQAAGETASPASDRYALGVVAYELLTGRRPFARESPTAEAAAHVNEPV
ncbi:MAG: protein kinase, partial [Gemmatimonadaceae bacterium]